MSPSLQIFGRNAVVSSSGCVQKVVGVPVVTYLNCGLPHLSQVVRIEESTFMQQECRRAGAGVGERGGRECIAMCCCRLTCF